MNIQKIMNDKPRMINKRFVSVEKASNELNFENAIKLAAADDGFVTYDEIRENLRK